MKFLSQKQQYTQQQIAFSFKKVFRGLFFIFLFFICGCAGSKAQVFENNRLQLDYSKKWILLEDISSFGYTGNEVNFLFGLVKKDAEDPISLAVTYDQIEEMKEKDFINFHMKNAENCLGYVLENIENIKISNKKTILHSFSCNVDSTQKFFLQSFVYGYGISYSITVAKQSFFLNEEKEEIKELLEGFSLKKIE